MSANDNLPEKRSPNSPLEQARPSGARSARALAKAIFKADVPEEYIKTLPAVSVYLSIRANGLESSSLLLEILTTEQYRTCLDLDLWSKDNLSEDRFFQWLALTEENNDFKALHKFLRTIDMRLVGAIIGRTTHSVVFDEPTEEPPGPNYYTPDKGFTWISLHFEDPERVRLLGKLLAYIFENNTELFYQLLSLPTVNTPAELEETAYTERIARLSDEGFPDRDSALEANTPADRNALIATARLRQPHPLVEDIRTIEPVISGTESLQPLGALLIALKNSPKLSLAFESELSWLTNAALVVHGIPHGDYDAIQEIIDQLKGSINIGLEDLSESVDSSLVEIFESVGLKELHRLGVYHLRKLRRLARSLPEETLRKVSSESEIFSVIAQAREDFPFRPLALNADGSFTKEDGKIIPGRRPFEKLAEIKTVSDIVSRFIQ